MSRNTQTIFLDRATCIQKSFYIFFYIFFSSFLALFLFTGFPPHFSVFYAAAVFWETVGMVGDFDAGDSGGVTFRSMMYQRPVFEGNGHISRLLFFWDYQPKCPKTAQKTSFIGPLDAWYFFDVAVW